MQLLTLLAFAIGIIGSGSQETRYFQDKLQSGRWDTRPGIKQNVFPRWAMPPRFPPGTPPSSQRQSIDTVLTSGKQDAAPTAPSKDSPKDTEKQRSSSAAPKPKRRSKPPRSPSPQSSSGSDHGFVRTSEMPTARIYGPPSSSDEDEAREFVEARRRRFSQSQTVGQGYVAPRRYHYSSDDFNDRRRNPSTGDASPTP